MMYWSNIKIHHKLSLIVMLLILPMLLFKAVSLYGEINQIKRIDTTLRGLAAVEVSLNAISALSNDLTFPNERLFYDQPPSYLSPEDLQKIDAAWATLAAPNEPRAKRIRAARQILAHLERYPAPIPDGAFALKKLTTDLLPHLAQRVSAVSSLALSLSERDELSSGNRMSLLVNAGQFKVLADTVSNMTKTQFENIPAPHRDQLEMKAAEFRASNVTFQRALASFASKVNTLSPGSDLPIGPVIAATGAFASSISMLSMETRSVIAALLIQERSWVFTYTVTTSLLTLAVVAVAVIAAYFNRRSILRRIASLKSDIHYLATAEIDAPMPSTAYRDEIGEIAKAVVDFRDATATKSAEAAIEGQRTIEQNRREMMAELQSEFGQVVEAAIKGDFSQRAKTTFNDPELNALAVDLNSLLTEVHEALSVTGDALARVANGDLEQRLDGEMKGAFATLQQDVNATIDQLSDLISQITATSAVVSNGAGSITLQADALADRTGQQAQSLSQTNTTVMEIAASIQENAESSRQARQLAASSSERAAHGQDVIQKAVLAMAEIEGGAGKISEIITVINGIAFQTNLLALNAAVEAARAGEAGKGFAVVASEVRNLAQRSADAAKDIAGLIETSVDQVEDGVKLVTEAGASLESIVQSFAQVQEAVESVAKASAEQSEGVNRVSEAFKGMDLLTQQNKNMAEESSFNARELEKSAEGLRSLLAIFQSSPAEETSLYLPGNRKDHDRTTSSKI